MNNPQTCKIASIEGALTKNSASPMWRCTTDTGVRVNVFKHNDPAKDSFHLFQDAGWGDVLLKIDNGQRATFQLFPIGVTIVQDGQWWAVAGVEPCPPGAEPDPVYQPDLDWYNSKAQMWAEDLDLNALYFDTETTGFTADSEIISITILDWDGATVFSSLIQPTKPERVTSAASVVHGITPDMLADAPTFAEVYDKIHAIMDGRPWVAYNVEFDARMIDQSCELNSLTPILPAGLHDAMDMYSKYAGLWDTPRQRWEHIKLSEAMEREGFTFENAHDASADVQALYKLVDAMRCPKAD